MSPTRASPSPPELAALADHPVMACGSICERLGLLAGWLEAECRRLGVALELGHRATPADVEGADAVVLGPGSPPAELPFPVDDDPRAVTALTILSGNGQV